MDAVLAFMLGVVEALDGGKTNKSENGERQRVAESSLHAGANGFLDLSEVFLELLTDGNNTSSEDEGTNAEIHERSSESLSLAEAARENGEVDGKNAAASDNHHGTTVAGDERLDGKRVPLLGLLIFLGLLVGIVVLLCEYLIAFKLSSGLQESSNCWQKQKTSKSLGRVGVDSGCTEDCAALQQEIHEESLGAVRLEESLLLLQNTPDENGNLWAVVRRYVAAAADKGRRAYRSQEGQDVDLPDATTLQVGDRGPFLRLVVWRHFGELSTVAMIVVQLATNERKAGQKDLRSAAFSSGPVANARARRSQEKLAQQPGGEISEGIGRVLEGTFGQQQPCREPREIGDWRLDVEEPTSPPFVVVLVLVVVLFLVVVLVLVHIHIHPPPAVRRGCIRVAQYLQWQHRTRRFVPWSRRDAALCVLQEAPCMWGRCCCLQECVVGGKSVLLVGRRCCWWQEGVGHGHARRSVSEQKHM